MGAQHKDEGKYMLEKEIKSLGDSPECSHCPIETRMAMGTRCVEVKEVVVKYRTDYDERCQLVTVRENPISRMDEYRCHPPVGGEVKLHEHWEDRQLVCCVCGGRVDYQRSNSHPVFCPWCETDEIYMVHPGSGGRLFPRRENGRIEWYYMKKEKS